MKQRFTPELDDFRARHVDCALVTRRTSVVRTKEVIVFNWLAFSAVALVWAMIVAFATVAAGRMILKRMSRSVG